MHTGIVLQMRLAALTGIVMVATAIVFLLILHFGSRWLGHRAKLSPDWPDESPGRDDAGLGNTM